MGNKIPKIIHYCWFGPNEKPKSVQKYIAGWRQKLPDYKIIEWNESNFDINCCDYVKEAYKAKKFAFVSDYARLKALYEHGGVYLDTDVEVFKDISPLLSKAVCVFGFEELNYVATSTMFTVPKQPFINSFMLSYHNRHFTNNKGELDMTTNVERLTAMLKNYGLNVDGSEQLLDIDGNKILVLPQDYFSPFDYINCYDKTTKNSYTKHHFDISWGKKRLWFKKRIKTIVTNLFGKNVMIMIRSFYK